jgi:hypothetical protein
METLTTDKAKTIRIVIAIVLIVAVIATGVTLIAVNWDDIMQLDSLFTLEELHEARDSGFRDATAQLQSRIAELERELDELDAIWEERYAATVVLMQAEIDRLTTEIVRLSSVNEMYRDSLSDFFHSFATYLPHLELNEFLLEFYKTVEADLVDTLIFNQASLMMLPSEATLRDGIATATTSIATIDRDIAALQALQYWVVKPGLPDSNMYFADTGTGGIPAAINFYNMDEIYTYFASRNIRSLTWQGETLHLMHPTSAWSFMMNIGNRRVYVLSANSIYALIFGLREFGGSDIFVALSNLDILRRQPVQNRATMETQLSNRIILQSNIDRTNTQLANVRTRIAYLGGNE